MFEVDTDYFSASLKFLLKSRTYFSILFKGVVNSIVNEKAPFNF